MLDDREADEEELDIMLLDRAVATDTLELGGVCDG